MFSISYIVLFCTIHIEHFYQSRDLYVLWFLLIYIYLYILLTQALVYTSAHNLCI